jgi:hypothetical protein
MIIGPWLGIMPGIICCPVIIMGGGPIIMGGGAIIMGGGAITMGMPGVIIGCIDMLTWLLVCCYC